MPADLAARINAFRLRAHGSLRVFGDWFGRPYDNDHQLTAARAEGEALILDFDHGERLTVWGPAELWLGPDGSLRIERAERVRWEFFRHGRPRTDENRYTIEHLVEGGSVSARSEEDWFTPSLQPSLDMPAVELLNAGPG